VPPGSISTIISSPGRTTQSGISAFADFDRSPSSTSVGIGVELLGISGYLMQQHGVRLRRPVRAYDRWFRRMPAEYARSVLGEASASAGIAPEEDPNLVATIKHFRSLIALGQEARKPIFSLTPADGAMGAHSVAANAAYKDFEELSKELLQRMAGPPQSPR